MSWDNQLTILNQKLADLYPQKEQSYRVVAMAGIPASSIGFQNAAIDNWFNILSEAKRRKKVNDLVQVVANEYPELTEIKDLYKQATNKNIMQKVSKLHLDGIKKAINEGYTEKAISSLEEIAKQVSTETHNSIIMQSAKLNRLKRERDQGVISIADYRMYMARIEYALLNIIDDIPEEQQLEATLKSLSRTTNSIETINLTVPDSDEFEKVIGREELFEINWVQKALVSAKSVCKVLRPDGESGTGFMLQGGYLITNHHVFLKKNAPNDADSIKERVSNSKIIFNYQNDIEGIPQPTTEYTLDLSTYYTNVETNLDYVIVKVKDNITQPLANWGHLELDTFSSPQIDDKVNIIQHPEGKSMRIALPDVIISQWKQYLFYVADTKRGSSGSPVFNQDWKVIALHHAGKNEDNAQGGLRINEAGDIKPSNRGILIKRIVEDLKEKGFTLFDN